MKEPNRKPWFGLDDLGGHSLDEPDTRPLYNGKYMANHDKALNDPKHAIDKDPDKPQVQKTMRAPSIHDELG